MCPAWHRKSRPSWHAPARLQATQTCRKHKLQVWAAGSSTHEQLEHFHLASAGSLQRRGCKESLKQYGQAMATGVKIPLEAVESDTGLSPNGRSVVLAGVCRWAVLLSARLWPTDKPCKSNGTGGGSFTFSAGFPAKAVDTWLDMDMSIIRDSEFGKSPWPQCLATLRRMACLFSLVAPSGAQLSMLSPTDDDTLASARSSEHSVLPRDATCPLGLRG
mmetsp:Transcript_13906/g.25626  ORF Transcript_13906/g.25626 Transcript_13906/m.25626 type:complete len:218 (+) Transcript_13906:788-1441(+)